ncbi:MAG: type II toxin-antitoxin system VapC family toxin [Acidobacteria bacterium]|nr:type II toxin-antitoxin system VapC family toxin [Acidobacteriota bacterium]
MIAYLDSSVLLRKLLGQAGALREWNALEGGVVSALVEVECLRTLDRWRLRQAIPEAEVALRREAVFRLLERAEVVEVTRVVLDRAAQPLPVSLGTLDAIHLATALLWGERSGIRPVMATHDATLGLAARAVGLRVAGL